MTKEELQERGKQMALRVIRLAESFPKRKTATPNKSEIGNRK